MEPLISLLVTLLVLGVIGWAILWLCDQLPLPPPFKIVVRVILILILIAILYLLRVLGVWGGHVHVVP